MNDHYWRIYESLEEIIESVKEILVEIKRSEE